MNRILRSTGRYLTEHYGELGRIFAAGSRERTGLFLTPVLAAFLLLLLDRFGLQRTFQSLLAGREPFSSMDSNLLAFYGQLYFSANTLLLFVLIPALFHLLFPIKEENGLGLGWADAAPHLPVYGLFLVVMVPVIWMVTRNPAFHRFYPMYDPESAGMLLLYEAFYLPHFFTVEFFFRGFLLFRLRRIMGYYAVAVAAVPYALIHIYKPMPEALGSVVAGIALGYLALKGRSIWPGVMVHMAVAASADFFSLIHSGRLGILFHS